MSGPEDYVYLLWEDGKTTIVKKSKAQEYVDAYHAKEHPGSDPPQIAEGSDFTGKLGKYKKYYKFTVKKISKQQNFLLKCRKTDEDRKKQEALEAEGVTKQHKEASNKKRVATTPQRKAELAVEKQSLIIQKSFEKQLQPPVSPMKSSGAPPLDLASESGTEATVCTCPECPFANIKKGMVTMALVMRILDELRAQFQMAQNALVSLHETTVTPPAQTAKATFNFPDVWEWQKPADGKTQIQVTSINQSGDPVKKNTGVYVNTENLKRITGLHKDKPSKMINALLIEMFGATHIASMSQSQIPQRAKNVVYAYVSENSNKEIKDFKTTVKNLCSQTKKQLDTVGGSSNNGSSNKKRKGKEKESEIESSGAEDIGGSTPGPGIPKPGEQESNGDSHDSSMKKRKVLPAENELQLDSAPATTASPGDKLQILPAIDAPKLGSSAPVTTASPGDKLQVLSAVDTQKLGSIAPVPTVSPHDNHTSRGYAEVFPSSAQFQFNSNGFGTHTHGTGPPPHSGSNFWGNLPPLMQSSSIEPVTSSSGSPMPFPSGPSGLALTGSAVSSALSSTQMLPEDMSVLEELQRKYGNVPGLFGGPLYHVC